MHGKPQFWRRAVPRPAWSGLLLGGFLAGAGMVESCSPNSIEKRADLITKLPSYVNDVTGDGVITIGFVDAPAMREKVEALLKEKGIDAQVVSGISNCDIVFGGAGAGGVLTVGDTRDFLVGGGVFAFVENSSTGRIEMFYSPANLAAARGRGLKVNSRLLKLAKPVDVKAE